MIDLKNGKTGDYQFNVQPAARMASRRAYQA